ncbi:MAG TPA: GntR family transcriptional regulator [Actinokineospora sp.]|jgi:DNA-binding GntR family transcriptional regulator|nr:GntR family transcriptional regulator [Actinokineospora sp.]
MSEASELDPFGSKGVTALTPIDSAPARWRKVDRVYDELISAIRDLRLPPGSPVSESDLAQRLGVSRTPIREAITRLAAQGLLHVVPQIGTSVALIKLPEVEEAAFIRCSLEVSAFRRACARPRDVAELRRILERQRAAVEAHDPERFFATDEELHREIFRLSGYPNVWNVVLGSKVQLDRVRRLYTAHAVRSPMLFDEHTRIVDLLEAGDVENGVELVATHTNRVNLLAPGLKAEHPAFFAED